MATREKIFEFDTTQSVDNLKRLKAEIKELKAALDQLEIGSKEYEETSDQLYAKQTRLTQVIKETKRPVEDAEGSFNSWLKTLRNLKEQWKATSDEMERSRLGAEINAVKEKINDANESIGNFQHNVGNYTNSIVDAFSKMGISIGGPFTKMSSLFGLLTGGLGKVMESFKKLWAVIVANPVTALIAALGVLISYWDDLKEALGNVKTAYDKVIDDTNDFTDALRDAEKEMNRTIKLMKAMGADELEVAAYRTANLKDKLEQTNQKLEGQKAELADLERWWKRIGRAVLSVLNFIIPIHEYTADFFGMNGKVDGLKESIKKLEEEQKNYNEAVADAGVDEYIAALDKDTKTTKSNTSAKKEATEEAKLLAEAIRDLEAAVNAEAGSWSKAQEEYDKGLAKASELLQDEMDKQKSAMQLEQESYEAKKALLEEYGLSTEELEENHQERMAEIRAEAVRKEYEELDRLNAEKDKQRQDELKKHEALQKAKLTASKNMAAGTSSILKNLSTTVGESTKLGKGFAIAAATIDTIAAAVSGFRAGMNQWADAGPMAWMAPVQAALNATMALTAGFAEVQKIRNVDTSGTSQGGGGGAPALAIPNIEGLSTPMDYTRQVVTDTEQEEMNRDQRVYILESDIQESGNRVRVREEETTF